jgi:hypothetical protein
MDYLEDSEYPDDDALQKYLDDEGLALVPIDFMRELMALMEAHIRNVCGVDREELNDIMARLEDLLGEDDMMDLSVDGIIGWVNTLKSV